MKSTLGVVMGMVIHAQFKSVSNSTSSPSKVPEYAKDFKNEWLYIRGINKKCGEFCKKLDEDPYDEFLFDSKRAKNLLKLFDHVLKCIKKGVFKDFKQLPFKLSVVYNIVDLRIKLYPFLKSTMYEDDIWDDNFQYFFEKVLFFTRRVDMIDFERFEDDRPKLTYDGEPFSEEFIADLLRILDSDEEDEE